MILNLDTLIKYFMEGLSVGLATYFITKQQSNPQDIFLIGCTAAITFLILDLFTSGIGAGARQGTGFGLGARVVGFGEGFESQYDKENNMSYATAESINQTNFSRENYTPEIDYETETQHLKPKFQQTTLTSVPPTHVPSKNNKPKPLQVPVPVAVQETKSNTKDKIPPNEDKKTPNEDKKTLAEITHKPETKEQPSVKLL